MTSFRIETTRQADAVRPELCIPDRDKRGSILYGSTGPCLAPLYDLLSTVIYVELSAKFAMKIGRQARLQDLDAQGWSDFAKKAELGHPFVRRRVRELAAKISYQVALKKIKRSRR